MEKTLVVVIAETRSYEYSFFSFKSNLLDSFGADLALCVASNQWEDTNNPFYKTAKYIWAYDEPDDWGVALDCAQQQEGGSGNWRILLQLDGILMGGVHDEKGRTRGSGSILLFFRWLLKQKLRDNELCKEYDRFVITRSDYIYLTPHFPLRMMDRDFIWIPDGEDYGGYTDRHIVVSSNDVLSVLSVADSMLREPEALYRRMYNRKEWNLERYIRFAFIELGLDHKVRRYPYTMYAVRSSDGRTSWSTGAYSKRHGYCIKYRDEHRKSLLAKKMISQPEDWTPETCRAFQDLVGFTNMIQHYTNLRIHSISNSTIRTLVCRAIYGSILSDRFFELVYGRLCCLRAFILKMTGGGRIGSGHLTI